MGPNYVRNCKFVNFAVLFCFVTLQMIPTLQYYKYLYAIHLVDHGLATDALHYLEEVAAHIAKRPGEYY